MKNTRLCIVNGDKTYDQQLDVIGTTLHHIPLNRWTDELAKQESHAEVKALADEFATDRQEDRRAEAAGRDQRGEDLLRGQADHGGRELPGHFAELPGPGRRTADSLPAVHGVAEAQRRRQRRLLRMRLERGDLAAAVRLVDRPARLHARPRAQHGQRHVHGRALLVAHQAPRLRPARRAGDPPQPQRVGARRLAAGDLAGGRAGDGDDVRGPGKIILGTGKVVANIDTPPCGGCRTSVELEMDNVADPRDCKGFHQLFILGKHDRLFRAYCQLAGIEVVPIA